MSAINRLGEKVKLPRAGADEFWTLVCEHFAGDDHRKWKYLAMLALRENAGWPLECIGLVFSHQRGHITRCLGQIKQELRDQLSSCPEFLTFLHLDAQNDAPEHDSRHKGIHRAA